MPRPSKTAQAKAKNALLAQQQANKDSTLSVKKAAVLVDKNSHTIRKLSQLLAIYNKPGASELDSKGRVAHRIERYKHRITRRLHKLAQFVDTPEHERPVERVPGSQVPPSRKAALDNIKQKRQQHIQQQQEQEQAKLLMKAKAKAKIAASSSMMMEKMKAQKAQQLIRNAQLKAKGAAANNRSKSVLAALSLQMSDPFSSSGDSAEPSVVSRPPFPATALPPLPPLSKRFPAPPQIIYSAARNTCKHSHTPPPALSQPAYAQVPQPLASTLLTLQDNALPPEGSPKGLNERRGDEMEVEADNGVVVHDGKSYY